MFRLFLIGGIVYLLSSKPKQGNDETAVDAFPAMEGGKNLVFNKLPLNEFGLPVALHVYSSDFPLVEGDYGNLVAVVQQMVNASNYGFTIPVTGYYDHATRIALFNESMSLDEFIALATDISPVVGKVEVYEFKPGA